MITRLSIAETEKVMKDIKTLKTRNKRPGVLSGVAKEPISEREFVRKFGSKVAHVRYSNRVDFVGLMISGHKCGVWVTATSNGTRKLRRFVIVNGEMKVIPTVIELRNDDSVTNLFKGLLNWIQ